MSVGVVFAVAAAGGSYAYLSATTPVGVGGATISAGNASITLQRGSNPPSSTLTIPPDAYQRMLPGDVVNQTLTVTNNGQARLAMTVALASDDGAWETRFAVGPCSGTAVSGTLLSSTPGPYGTLDPGASTDVCVQVTLPSTAPAASMNTSLSYTINITGTQVTP